MVYREEIKAAPKTLATAVLGFFLLMLVPTMPVALDMRSMSVLDYISVFAFTLIAILIANRKTVIEISDGEIRVKDIMGKRAFRLDSGMRFTADFFMWMPAKRYGWKQCRLTKARGDGMLSAFHFRYLLEWKERACIVIEDSNGIACVVPSNDPSAMLTALNQERPTT